MAKTQGDSEDERWLAGLRGDADRAGDTSRRALAPDPWLDGPFPTTNANQPEQPADEPAAPDAAPDPWGGSAEPWAAATPPQGEGSPDAPAEARDWQPRQQQAPAPMPTYQPQPPATPMPQVPPASEPLPIPRLDDPWAPRPSTPGEPASYQIPRLAQPQASADGAQADGRRADHTQADERPTNSRSDADRHEASPAGADQTEAGAAAEPQAPAGPPDLPTAPPTGQAAPPTGETAPYAGQDAPSTGQAAPPTGQFGAPVTHQQPPSAQPASQQQWAPQHPQHQPAQPAPQQPAQPPQQAQQQPMPQYGPPQPLAPEPGQVHPGGFQQPTAPTSGAFAVPQQPGPGVPAQFGGSATQPPSIMPLDLSDSALVRQRKAEPDSGWRKAVYRASFGGINPGISREQTEKNALIERIRTPIRGCHKIAVVSLKGGIGKTTTTSCLGLTLAHYRGDRVVALDANPDAGTLAERLTGVTDVSVRDMLDNIDKIDSFTDISRFMSLASRLQVLASDQDAEVSEAFDSQQYRKITGLLSRYYNVILTDSGTGMLHSAMQGTLEEANSLVVVGAPSVDGSSRAAKTLDWLVAHGYGDLVAGSVAVISSVREKSDAVDMDVLRNHFGARCRSVIEIPYDPHLVIGGRIDMAQIRPQTEHAYLELAATVADGFSHRA